MATAKVTENTPLEAMRVHVDMDLNGIEANRLKKWMQEQGKIPICAEPLLDALVQALG